MVLAVSIVVVVAAVVVVVVGLNDGEYSSHIFFVYLFKVRKRVQLDEERKIMSHTFLSTKSLFR